MSEWSYIHISLEVSIGMYFKNPEYEIKRILEFAPKITGSEGGPDIFINIKSGYNCSTSSDCANCYYRNTIKKCKGGGFTCKKPNEYICPDGEFQSQAIITIHGNLRDRNIDTTKKEFIEFKKYLKRAGIIIYHQVGRV